MVRVAHLACNWPELTVVSAQGRFAMGFENNAPTGRVASMASSQVKRKADKILEEFFSQAGQELGTAS